ncbi:MAG: hypothetical protein HYR55_08585 [Acidobacteria bacterium]|nr:hypothetical protein [Acidobacteriota bacterium]MBI3656381.1 hypothetical protein [Acidobacteriota bacterium]
MKYEIAVLGLWAIALFSTLALVKDATIFGHIGPLYAICMMGSVIIVRKARQDRPARG